MKIVDSSPGERVHVAVDFVRPFEGKSASEFSFSPEGNKTNVTWRIRGHNNFIAKAMCLFVSMDKMLGGEFEKGLAQMKSAAEAAQK